MPYSIHLPACLQGIKSAAIWAHSYGTLVASSLVKQRPELLDGLTLMDPVCFALLLPNLIRSTLYAHTQEDTSAKGSWTWKRLLKGTQC